MGVACTLVEAASRRLVLVVVAEVEEGVASMLAVEEVEAASTLAPEVEAAPVAASMVEEVDIQCVSQQRDPRVHGSKVQCIHSRWNSPKIVF